MTRVTRCKPTVLLAPLLARHELLPRHAVNRIHRAALHSLLDHINRVAVLAENAAPAKLAFHGEGVASNVRAPRAADACRLVHEVELAFQGQAPPELNVLVRR